jgi:hypothetical protein
MVPAPGAVLVGIRFLKPGIGLCYAWLPNHRRLALPITKSTQPTKHKQHRQHKPPPRRRLSQQQVKYRLGKTVWSTTTRSMNLTTSRGELYLQFDKCVHIATPFSNADLRFPAGPTQLALHEGSICPSAVNITEAEYATRYSGKAVMWLR